MSAAGPQIQLIANLVVRRPSGEVLFVRYDDQDERWWLPGGDLAAYEHPDERARAVLADLGIEPRALRMSHVESFRGRRGWHVVFHYAADADGVASGAVPAAWHAPDALPRTVHGAWEREAVARALGG